MNIQSDTLPTELPPGTAAIDWSARYRATSRYCSDWLVCLSQNSICKTATRQYVGFFIPMEIITIQMNLPNNLAPFMLHFMFWIHSLVQASDLATVLHFHFFFKIKETWLFTWYLKSIFSINMSSLTINYVYWNFDILLYLIFLVYHL